MRAVAAVVPARGVAIFASAGDAAQAFIADGTTAHARKTRAQSVHRFEVAFGGLAGWSAAPVPHRLDAPVDVRGVAVWLALATATPVDAAYVAAVNAAWGYRLADLDPRLAARFTAAASRLGWSDKQAELQWVMLAKLAAVAGQPAQTLTRSYFDAAREALAEAVRAQRGRLPNTLTTPLHGLQATLAAMGILDEPGGKRVPDRGRPGHWQQLTAGVPVVAGTMRRYLAQMGISMRPGSVKLIDTTLRHLADYLTGHHPGVTAVAQIRRTLWGAETGLAWLS
jgi:hypothetical protein